MKLIFTTQPIKNVKKSIFLAGPTPRLSTVKSWRPEAVKYFEEFKYNGCLFIPEIDWASGKRYEDLCLNHSKIIDWEHEGLGISDIVMFWVPRDLKDMPSFTTNIEFGLLLGSGKIIYGRPDNAPKNEYLDYCYKKACGEVPFNNLREMIKCCCEQV